MAEFPALPLWTDAFLADTTHLTAEDTGAYLLLLMIAWRRPNCDLPDDDDQLARFARMSLKQWRRRRGHVMAFWTLTAGCWRQKKLDEVRGAVVAKRAGAKRAARVRWSGQTDLTTSRREAVNHENHMPGDNANVLKNMKSSDANASIPHTPAHEQPKPKPKPIEKASSNDLDCPVGEATTEQNTAPPQNKVLGNYDFLSDCGSVLIYADEFKALEADLPNVKNIRGIVRQACRSWLLEFPEPNRKSALINWMRKKNSENTQRQSVKRDAVATRDAVIEDRDRRRKSDEALAVRARHSRKNRTEVSDDDKEPDGEFSAAGPDRCH